MTKNVKFSNTTYAIHLIHALSMMNGKLKQFLQRRKNFAVDNLLIEIKKYTCIAPCPLNENVKKYK